MAIKIFEYVDLFVFQFGPVFTWQDLLEVYSYSRANLQPPSSYSQHRLIDLRQTKASEVNYRKMMEYVQQLPLAPTGLKVALVVTAPAIFGYARMFQILTEQVVQPVEIFESMDSALDWLGVNDETREAITLAER